MVHHRILEFCLQGLLDKEVEATLFSLLRSISALCVESVDIDVWPQTVANVHSALVKFENAFPQLMVTLLNMLFNILTITTSLSLTWHFIKI